LNGEAAEAHRAAVAAALVGVVGTALSIVGYWNMPGARTVGVAGLLLNVGALIALHANRVRRSAAASIALFLVGLPPLVVMLWIIDAQRALQDVRWVPYEGHKLAALVIAMIAPPRWWVGLLAILAIVGTAVVHHAVLPPAARAHMVAGEPLGIFVFGSISLVLLAIMQRSRSLRVQLEHARSERLALSRLAHVAVSLRDLANTPLQTMELVRSALLTEGVDVREQARRLGNALARLKRLNDVLGPYQDQLPPEAP
jgi:hypothetical protein